MSIILKITRAAKSSVFNGIMVRKDGNVILNSYIAARITLNENNKKLVDKHGEFFIPDASYYLKILQTYEGNKDLSLEIDRGNLIVKNKKSRTVIPIVLMNELNEEKKAEYPHLGPVFYSNEEVKDKKIGMVPVEIQEIRSILADDGAALYGEDKVGCYIIDGQMKAFDHYILLTKKNEEIKDDLLISKYFIDLDTKETSTLYKDGDGCLHYCGTRVSIIQRVRYEDVIDDAQGIINDVLEYQDNFAGGDIYNAKIENEELWKRLKLGGNPVINLRLKDRRIVLQDNNSNFTEELGLTTFTGTVNIKCMLNVVERWAVNCKNHKMSRKQINGEVKWFLGGSTARDLEFFAVLDEMEGAVTTVKQQETEETSNLDDLF